MAIRETAITTNTTVTIDMIVMTAMIDTIIVDAGEDMIAGVTSFSPQRKTPLRR